MLPSQIPKQLPRIAASIAIAACFIVPLFVCFAGDTEAATYVFDGAAGSRVHLTETTSIQITSIPASIPNGSKVIFNASYPSSSPGDISGYSASYSNVHIDASPAPSSFSDMTDQFGNNYRQFVWNSDKITKPTFTFTITAGFDASLQGDLSTLSYDDPIGTSEYPEFRSSTAMVQSADPAIVSKKNALLAGATSEAEAVDRIVNFVKTNAPTEASNVGKDAVSSLNSHSGNCVNRAHLALALLRSAGIPARCVSGLLYADKYTVSYPYGGGTASTEITWASGSHVWIEVYYPQEHAWVAYDPWMDKGFVDSRHVRLAMSKDFSPSNTATRGYAGMTTISGFSAAPGPTSIAVSSSGLQDTLLLNYKYAESSPQDAFMVGRTMQSSRAPTATPTPSPTVTVRPNNTTNNTTVTPHPSNSSGQPGVTVTPTGGRPGDIPRYNLTGTIIDHDTGAPIQGATVMLDSIQVSANSSGKFVFLNALSGGMYNLTVGAPGYKPDVRSITPNGADMDVTIILNADKASATAPSPWGLPFCPGALGIVFIAIGGAFLRRKKKL